MKTVRFTQVVQRSGQPRVHTLWVAPDKDPEFARARDAHRVMTIQPSDTGKSDVGSVGYDERHARSGQFLIFPRSLKPFEGARVVGIKFDLVEQPDLVAAPAAIAPATPRKKARRVSDAPIQKPARLAETLTFPAPAAAEATEVDGDEESEKEAAPAAAPSRRVKHEPPARKARGGSTRRKKPERDSREEDFPPPATKAGASSRERARSHNRSDRDAEDRELLREVKLAMKELQAGKAVAAFQRLERAVNAAEK